MSTILSLDEKLFKGSHDTAVIGWNDKQEVIFLKSYQYDQQKDEAQSDLKNIIDAGLAWQIGHITNLKFESESETED